MGLRARSVNNQSPGRAEQASATYQSQLNQLTGGSIARRALNSDDTVIYELLRRRGDEEAHHKGILETLDLLYRGLAKEEAAELTGHLNRYHGMGNDILNLVNVPKDIHTGPNGIHPWAIEKGYQYHSNHKPRGFVQDLIEASEMPLEYRKHVGERYLTKAVPAMEQKINELLQDHPSMHEELDMKSVKDAIAAENKSKRMAGDVLSQLLGEGELTTGSVSGDKPIIVNADENASVYLHTNGKNGNGHVEMQEKFNENSKRNYTRMKR